MMMAWGCWREAWLVGGEVDIHIYSQVVDEIFTNVSKYNFQAITLSAGQSLGGGIRAGTVCCSHIEG